MTTSQASRLFDIPYNSLLMYVRGIYGKSLGLEVDKNSAAVADHSVRKRRYQNRWKEQKQAPKVNRCDS